MMLQYGILIHCEHARARHTPPTHIQHNTFSGHARIQGSTSPRPWAHCAIHDTRRLSNRQTVVTSGNLGKHPHAPLGLANLSHGPRSPPLTNASLSSGSRDGAPSPLLSECGTQCVELLCCIYLHSRLPLLAVGALHGSMDFLAIRLQC